MSGLTFSIRGYFCFFIFSLAVLTSLRMAVATVDADTIPRPGVRSGLRTIDSPKIFGNLLTKPGCCGRRPNALPIGLLGSPEYESYKLTATYWKLDGSLTTTLMLNNKGPEPILATPTFYSLKGTRLDAAPITVPAASYIDVDMGELLREAGAGFREGSLELVYQAGEFQLGAQVKMLDTEKGLMWAEQLVYTSKFTSKRLEGVWWLPNEDTKVSLAVSNTKSSAVTVAIAVDGTFPRQPHPIQIQLGPNETRVLDVLRELVTGSSATFESGGGISIEHTGETGAILARTFISDPERGYSAAFNLIDPELSASRKWHGSGLRLKNLDGEILRQILAVRNTSGEATQFRGRIPYTTPDGEVAFADIPETRIEANSTRIVRLNRIIEKANIPASTGYAGIELEYDSPPGTIITSVQSVSADGSHVFEVPMADPENLPASAGGFPWKADGDFRTLVYIKNETDTPKRYTAHLNFLGGGYSLGVREIKGGETVAIDFRELRDTQVPDAKGNIIPLNATAGQIAWSVKGRENKVLTGRSEQVSVSGGVASTYACSNCCPSSTYETWIDPYSLTDVVGSTNYFTANETEVNCYGEIFGPYQPWSVNWNSTNVNVATVDFGISTAVGAGTATIQAGWEGVIWFNWGGGYCEPWDQQINESAMVEIISVTITKADGSALPSPFRIGINAGGNDRTQSLKATVSPANQAANITIEVSSAITLAISQTNTSTGVITFSVVGNTKSSGKGDATITAKRSGSTLATKTVSVVVPSKVATPHDTMGQFVEANRVLDATTSPAVYNLPNNQVALATIYMRFLTITVKDQFGDLIGDVYLNATVTETIGTSTVSINQKLTSSSTYLDPVGQAPVYVLTDREDPSVAAWPSSATRQPLVNSQNQDVGFPVQVDGFTLSPGLEGRKVTATPPNTITVTWPDPN